MQWLLHLRIKIRRNPKDRRLKSLFYPIMLYRSIKFNLLLNQIKKFVRIECRKSEPIGFYLGFSSSGGIGILFSMANFFNASYFKRQPMVSSRKFFVLLCIISKFCHSCNAKIEYLVQK